MKKLRKYSDTFKEESVKLVTEQGYSQAEASRRLGISSKNMNRWVKEHEGLSRTPSATKRLTQGEQAELVALRKEIKRLKMERDILKKAAAFFANESS